MEFLIKKGKNTPEIKWNTSSKSLEISGRCFPEDTISFFNPVKKWVMDFDRNKWGESLNVVFELEYISSASIIVMLDLLKVLDRKRGEIKIEVMWKYVEDDEDIFKIGKDFEKIVPLKFQYSAMD